MESRTSPACRLGTLGLTTLVFSMLPGCVGNSPPKVDDVRVKQFSGRGYLTDDRYSIATTFANWTVGEHSFDVAWTVPVSGDSLPVVVYLPGLGESRTAGESWRTAWAQAGYAVLSVQLLNEDQRAWSSAAARRGDFGVLARERYGKDAATARLQALAALLTTLQTGHTGNAVLLHRLDLSHIAVAGFDVGAYTSMLVAGETPKSESALAPLPIPVAAIIALSPFADFSGTGLSTRYQSITMPVLSISGDADSDTAGVVSSPSLRRAPFEYMPSKDAYLLWLANAGHAIFSGSAPVDAAEEQIPGRRNESQGARKGGGRRHGGSGYPDTAATDADSKGVGGRPPSGPMASPTDRALNVSLIQGVSTAFLDAYLKHDAVAQEWLRKDAKRWVGDRGDLQRKKRSREFPT
jgi:pimeloyl-ACP methyl ester carboxylesterase